MQTMWIKVVHNEAKICLEVTKKLIYNIILMIFAACGSKIWACKSSTKKITFKGNRYLEKIVR